MSALLSALDTIERLQLGENNNPEYTWSNDVEEMITQFHFQLTRTSDTIHLEDKYQELLKKIFVPVFNGEIQSIEYIKLIYKLIGYTRDIVSGKGEYNLTYMLISGLYKFSKTDNCPESEKFKLLALTTSALESLVRINIGEHPYGSWKDLKYFCNYHIDSKDRTEYGLKRLNDPLFNKIVDLVCGQLQSDENSPVKSLLAKWVPREKSKKFGWIVPVLAMRYYKNWISEDLSKDQFIAARKKCLTHFRQLVAKINKELNTTQIYQCNRAWKDINFDKNVTSITLRKQSKAFQSKDKNGKQRSELMENEDRLQCKQNYEEYISRCKTGKSIAKGKRVSVVDFVRDALNINIESAVDTIEKDCINLQWEDNGRQNNALGDLIAMVDTSGSMEDNCCLPLYSALGLGIRIAEKSRLGKRILTFSSNPTWLNLENCPDFVSMVTKTRTANWGMNTNIMKAFELILDTAVTNNIPPLEMGKITLVILSDMQIDRCTNKEDKNDTMFEMMKTKYYAAGMRSQSKEPYQLPHIIFWNLRSTTGFPSLSTTKNTTMMSGNNPVLLNTFCKEGLKSLKDLTPWRMLVQELSKERYMYLENIVTTLWSPIV
jgi:hypothetical protein